MATPSRTLEQIKRAHQQEPVATGGMYHCGACREVWPCDAAQMVERYEGLLHVLVNGSEGVLALLDEASDKLLEGPVEGPVPRLVDTSRSLVNAMMQTGKAAT